MLSLEILWGNKAAHFRIQEIGSNQTSQMESILMCSVFRTNFRIKTSDNKRRLNQVRKMWNPKTKDQARITYVLLLFAKTA